MSSNFLQFNPDQTNALSDTDYANSATRTGGLVAGKALSTLHNKMFYQWSTAITALTDVFVNLGYTVSDSDLSTLTTVFSNILTSGVVDGTTLQYVDDVLAVKDASITTAKLAGGVAVPIGATFEYAGSTAPAGYLLCDGSAVSRTTYANLYAVIGTTYGTGDGSTTFALPDIRGKFPLGKTASGTYTTLGGTGGETTHTLTTSEMPSHTHTVPLTSWNAHSGTALSNDTPYYSSSGTAATNSTGGGGAHNNMPPYIIMNYIIKY